MTDCGVCIGIDYGDCDGPVELCETRWPKAVKEHVCVECSRAIPKGEIYQRCSGKFDGDFYDEKTCAECADIRDAFTCEVPPPFGQLWAEIREFVFPQANTSCFDKMASAKAKEVFRKRWMEYKGLTA